MYKRQTITRLKTYKKHGTTALESAPLAIVVAADAEKSDVWVEDASIAATFLQVEAEALGLGSNWIQLRRRESDAEPSETAFRRELGLPDHYLSLIHIFMRPGRALRPSSTAMRMSRPTPARSRTAKGLSLRIF